MKFSPRLLVVALTGCLVGCGSHARPIVAPPPPPTALPVTAFTGPVGRQVQLIPDAIAAIIGRVEREFAAGEAEQQAGRLVAARERFDAAVDMLLAQPDGVRAEPRLSAEFELLLDRISALDLQALREADGFAETPSAPAAIDELLSAATFERPAPAMTTEETVAADLQRTAHDVNIPVNDRVLSFIELFQGRLHEFMESGLERSQRYMPMIQRVFQSEGLPLDLAYVPLVESAFKPNALSRVSARGMWQFMLGTAQEHGLEQNWFIDERSDPEKATRAAAQYLKTLRDFFDGDWNLALASYNAGPGRIQRAVSRAKTDDYWRLTSSSKYLPRETRDYVPMIMAAIVIARNPQLYGFEVSAVDPLSYERVTVPNALDLKIIAEWIGTSVDELRELNPELRRTTTPMADHELKVPVGTAATITSRLSAGDVPFVRFNIHTVKRGETLASIARKYKVTQNELRAANDLSSRTRVRSNQELMIPTRTSPALPTMSASRSAVTAAPSRPSGAVTYRVQRGDTLLSIARRFDTTVGLIKELNQLRTDKINVGDRLTVKR